MSYHVEKFYTERDIVWTIQKALIEKINRNGSRYKGYRVLNDFSIEQGNKIRVDLAIFEKVKSRRKRIGRNLLQNLNINRIPPERMSSRKISLILILRLFFGMKMVGGSVKKYIRRVRNYVNMNTRTSGISILIDEGNLFYKLGSF